MSEEANQEITTSEESEQQVRLTVDERKMETVYANAFRTHVTQEEVVMDYGFNLLTGAADERRMNFAVNNRVIVNYNTAKRLAIALGQIVRNYENQFGEIKLPQAKEEGEG